MNFSIPFSSCTDADPFASLHAPAPEPAATAPAPSDYAAYSYSQQYQDPQQQQQQFYGAQPQAYAAAPSSDPSASASYAASYDAQAYAGYSGYQQPDPPYSGYASTSYGYSAADPDPSYYNNYGATHRGADATYPLQHPSTEYNSYSAAQPQYSEGYATQQDPYAAAGYGGYYDQSAAYQHQEQPQQSQYGESSQAVQASADPPASTASPSMDQPAPEPLALQPPVDPLRFSASPAEAPRPTDAPSAMDSPATSTAPAPAPVTSKVPAWSSLARPLMYAMSYEPLEYRPPPSFEEPKQEKEEDGNGLKSPGVAHRMAEQRRDEQDEEILKRLRGGGLVSSSPASAPAPGPIPAAPPQQQPQPQHPNDANADSARPKNPLDDLLYGRPEYPAPPKAAAPAPPESDGTSLDSARRRSSEHAGPPAALPADFRSLQLHIEALEEEKYELKRGLELQGRKIEELTLAADQAYEESNRHARQAEALGDELARAREAARAQDASLAAATAEREDLRAGLRESLDRCKNLAQEVISLEEQVRRMKADLYKAQAQAKDAEGRLAGAAREAEERWRESQKTIEFLKEQIDIQARAYDERLEMLREGGGTAGSHQEFLLRQTVASLEARVQEVEQAAEMQLLALQASKEREAAELTQRLAAAEAAAGAQREASAQELEALRAECVRLEAQLAQAQQSMTAAQQGAALQALQLDPVLKALAETLRRAPELKGADASLSPADLITAVTAGAAAVAAKQAGKIGTFIPPEIAALLPDPSVPLTVDLLGERALSEEAAATADSIFRMLEELEEEREMLVMALERQKRAKDALKAEVRALREGAAAAATKGGVAAGPAAGRMASFGSPVAVAASSPGLETPSSYTGGRSLGAAPPYPHYVSMNGNGHVSHVSAADGSYSPHVQGRGDEPYAGAGHGPAQVAALQQEMLRAQQQNGGGGWGWFGIFGGSNGAGAGQAAALSRGTSDSRIKLG